MKLKINKELFGFLVENIPGWYSTPEGFKKMVVAADAFSYLDSGHGDLHTYKQHGQITPYGRRFAHIVQDGLGIEMGSYQDIDDLLDHCPACDVLGLVSHLVNEEKLMLSLDDELESLGMVPSEETMREFVLKDALLTISIRRLHPFIDFV